MSTALAQLAKRLSVSESEIQNIVLNTVMPNGGKGITNDQFVSFIAVANEYKLNPLVKEIYAFPAKGGGIQPIVSIDGWLRIINSHKDFNGMIHEDIFDDKHNLVAIKCSIYKKNADHPITVTEYMSECAGTSEPWKRWPSRMLRHKSTIQCGRYAFGISGIIDPDEAERFNEVGVIEKDITPKEKEELTPENKEKWSRAIAAFQRDGNLEKVKSVMSLSDENEQKIIEQASAA